MKLRPVSMDFNYGSSFGERSPSAYETLLLDAMIGDATLYTRQDMVEASWARGRADSERVARDRSSIFRTTPPGPGGRRPPTRCWRGAATPGGSHDAQPSQPEKILQELADLWVSLGKDADRRPGAGVLRACTMTLVVLAEESGGPDRRLGETMAALMPEHPAAPS